MSLTGWPAAFGEGQLCFDVPAGDAALAMAMNTIAVRNMLVQDRLHALEQASNLGTFCAFLAWLF
jgi:hypothetical protein